MGSTTYYITNSIKTFFFNFVYNFTQNNIIHLFLLQLILLSDLNFKLSKIQLLPPEDEFNFRRSQISHRMNESSSSMRITRGIPLHINFVDNLPSFSMGLTQDFGVDVGSMVKSKQAQHEQTMKELRSKKKYDLTAVQEVINNAKARGIKIVQGGRKRKAV
ncbi:hypothetical protein EJD97_011074 [Solanum chilense]|uniref:Uncharacterized protein n=1 Tax=Solanum chilense TaxID=4083 RepID=A0A6N2AG82_SOLCI|nr:hypothetical protein EJD97_011074 [Solanum chilense]